jgi:hypothetical protein
VCVCFTKYTQTHTGGLPPPPSIFSHTSPHAFIHTTHTCLLYTYTILSLTLSHTSAHTSHKHTHTHTQSTQTKLSPTHTRPHAHRKQNKTKQNKTKQNTNTQTHTQGADRPLHSPLHRAGLHCGVSACCFLCVRGHECIFYLWMDIYIYT